MITHAVNMTANLQAPAFARRTLSSTGLIPTRYLPDVLLLVSELVTNAVRHGTIGDGTIGLRISRSSQVVRVEVEDPGNGFPIPGQAMPAGGGGVGLKLIEDLSTRWGIESEPNTMVWFEIDVR